MTATAKNEIALSDKFKSALTLIKRVTGITKITTPEQYENAKLDYKALITAENEVDSDYKAHPAIIAAGKIKAVKVALEKDLDTTKKGLKNGPMLAWERELEEKRLARERELQAIADAEAKKENDRLLAEQKKEFDRLEVERKKAAKKGDTEAAAALAAQAAEVKTTAQEMKANPLTAAAVVLDKVPTGVSRRMVSKWRIKLADGKVYSKADFNKTLRVKPADVPGVPSHFFVLDPTAISGVIDSLGKNHGIPGVTWYEEPA